MRSGLLPLGPPGSGYRRVLYVGPWLWRAGYLGRAVDTGTVDPVVESVLRDVLIVDDELPVDAQLEMVVLRNPSSGLGAVAMSAF